MDERVAQGNTTLVPRPPSSPSHSKSRPSAAPGKGHQRQKYRKQREKGRGGMHFCNRKFQGSTSVVEQSCGEVAGSVSIMSYNVLANEYARTHVNELYSTVPKTCLRWHTRASLIAKEIQHWSPDIVCLQEVDRYNHLKSLLASQGYVGRYLKRPNGRPDGLAMFWKRDKFDLVESKEVVYAGLGLRDNVAQVYRLRCRHVNGTEGDADCDVVISNIHVLFNPKRGDIKLGQIRVLLDTISKVSGGGRMHPIVMCGDYNSAPHSCLYEFIEAGFLDFLRCDRRHISGQIADSRPKATIVKSPKPSKPWKEEEIFLATGMKEKEFVDEDDMAYGTLQHAFQLKSSYRAVLGEEPLFTTAHDKYIGTVDYIFYSCPQRGGLWNMVPTQVLHPPQRGAQAIVPKGLPHGFWPSDHICIMTRFDIVRRD